MRGRYLAIVVAIALNALPGTVRAEIEWPGLRGPNFDGSVRGVEMFSAEDMGLTVGWRASIGSGYSAVAVGNGMAVTMHVGGENDVVSAFDVETGKEAWRYRIDATYVGHDGSHDGPISTPLLSGNRVFGLSPRGKLFALNAKDGSEVWSTQLVEDHAAKMPYYGFATSAVLVDEVLVVQFGAAEGKAIGGFDPADGKLLWAVGDDEINYQSPILATIGGKTQVVAVGNKKLFGIDAAAGKILWEYEHGGDGRGLGSASIVPVPTGPGRFLLETNSDSSKMVQVAEHDGAYEVTELWSNNGLRATYVTPAYHDGYLYGMNGRVFVCVDAATGETQWKSRQPGDGFPTVIGDKIAMIVKPGSLHVIDASPKGYNEIAQIDLFDENSWSEVAFASGHLFVRSMNEIVRVDFEKNAAPTPTAGWIRATRFGEFLEQVNVAQDKTAVVDAFMAAQKTFPIVESPDVVHFVYRGKSSDVGIVGDLIGARREDPMVHVPGTDLFYYSKRVEPGTAATYGFIVDYGEKPVADPRNGRAGSGLFGDVSFFSMPGWKGFAYESDAATQGSMETVEWESAAKEGAKRSAEVYLPAGYDASARYPVVYVQSGREALEDGLMKNTLDHVVGSSVQPLIAVFVRTNEEDQGDTQTPAYYEMVAGELVPLIDAKYSTITTRAGRATIGAGDGANVALTLAFGKSDTFGHVAAQSANLGFFGPVSLDDLVKSADEQPMTVYLDWGTYHLRAPHEAWDMAADSRKAWAMLRERGYHPVGGERPEGYAWPCWRAHTDEVLVSLFPN